MNNYDQVDDMYDALKISTVLNRGFNDGNRPDVAKLNEMTKQCPKGQIIPWTEFLRKTSLALGPGLSAGASVQMNAKNLGSK